MKTTTGTQTIQNPDEAARKGLQDLMKLANEMNFKELGFGSLEEVKNAQLGPSSRLRTFSYDNLLTYKEGASINELFTKDEQLIYPVTVGGISKTTIIVEKSGDNWKVFSAGDRGFGKRLDDGRKDFKKRNLDSLGVKDTDFFLISAPGIGFDFYAYTYKDELMMVPSEQYKDLKLSTERYVGTKDALPVLTDYVKVFDKKYGEEIKKKKLVK